MKTALSIALLAVLLSALTQGVLDNCPGVYNPDQADSTGDGVGDACDPNYLPPAPSPSPTAGGEGEASAGEQLEENGFEGDSSGLPEGISGEPVVDGGEEDLEEPWTTDPKALPPRVTPSTNESTAFSNRERVEQDYLAFDLGARTVAIPLPARSDYPWIGLFLVLLTAAVFYYREKQDYGY